MVSPADDVAWLRKHAHVDEGPRYPLTQVLDRIADALPERVVRPAIGYSGLPLWLHGCGTVIHANEAPRRAGCLSCQTEADWQMLLVAPLHTPLAGPLDQIEAKAEQGRREMAEAIATELQTRIPDPYPAGSEATVEMRVQRAKVQSVWREAALVALKHADTV